MKDGIPKSLSSHCAGKPNPKLWKYIKIQQWRCEMGHASSSQRLDVSSQCCENDVISIRILFEHKTL